MPAPFRHESEGLVEYLVKGTKSANNRASALEIDEVCSAWIDPVLLNSYAEPSGSYRSIQYRWQYKTETLEFRGRVDVTNAVTDTVAFQIDSVYLPPDDTSFLIDISDGAEVATARASIDSTTGDVTLTWPIGGGATIPPGYAIKLVADDDFIVVASDILIIGIPPWLDGWYLFGVFGYLTTLPSNSGLSFIVSKVGGGAVCEAAFGPYAYCTVPSYGGYVDRDGVYGGNQVSTCTRLTFEVNQSAGADGKGLGVEIIFSQQNVLYPGMVAMT